MVDGNLRIALVKKQCPIIQLFEKNFPMRLAIYIISFEPITVNLVVFDFVNARVDHYAGDTQLNENKLFRRGLPFEREWILLVHRKNRLDKRLTRGGHAIYGSAIIVIFISNVLMLFLKTLLNIVYFVGYLN